MSTRVPVRWFTVRETARRMGVRSPTLRKRLERSASRHRGHVEARLHDDLVARKLGTRWYLSNLEPWRAARDHYCVREAAAILGKSPAALRKLLERHAQAGRADVDGILGRKRPGGQWRVYFSNRWTQSQQENRA